MKPRTSSWITAGVCALALTLAGSAYAQAGDPVAGKAVRERVRAEKAAQRAQAESPEAKAARERVRAEKATQRAQAESPEAKAARRAQKQGAVANRPVRDQQGLSFQVAMRQADKDRNGTISPDEFREAMDKIFKEADVNRDGTLERNEINRANRALFPAGDTTGQRPEAAAANVRGRVPAQDKDGDGRISRSEWQGVPERFKNMDKNGDGYLTREEMRQVAETLQNPNLGRGQGAGGPGGPGGPGAPRPAAKERAANLLKTQDQDGDGKVSATEFKGREQAFRRMDKNNDGFLTLQEILETGSQVRERRGQQGGNGPFPPQPPNAPQPPRAPRAKSS